MANNSDDYVNLISENEHFSDENVKITPDSTNKVCFIFNFF
jgi:hypothetical protein